MEFTWRSQVFKIFHLADPSIKKAKAKSPEKMLRVECWIHGWLHSESINNSQNFPLICCVDRKPKRLPIVLAKKERSSDCWTRVSEGQVKSRALFTGSSSTHVSRYYMKGMKTSEENQSSGEKCVCCFSRALHKRASSSSRWMMTTMWTEELSSFIVRAIHSLGKFRKPLQCSVFTSSFFFFSFPSSHHHRFLLFNPICHCATKLQIHFSSSCSFSLNRLQSFYYFRLLSVSTYSDLLLFFF